MIDDGDSEDEESDGDDAEEMGDEDEDEEGFTDLEEEAGAAHDGDEKVTDGRKASLYKAPTAEEMEELRRQEEERGGHFGFAMKVSSYQSIVEPSLTGHRSMPYCHRPSWILCRRIGPSSRHHKPRPPCATS